MSDADTLGEVNRGTDLPLALNDKARELLKRLKKERGIGVTRLAPLIGISQPALTKLAQGGGMRPGNAIKLWRFAGEDPSEVTRALELSRHAPVTFRPSSAETEGERLATLASIDHEWKHARYVNLEIHLASQPPNTYKKEVIALARAREWDVDVPPWEWPERLSRVSKWLAITDFDRDPPARGKTL